MIRIRPLSVLSLALALLAVGASVPAQAQDTGSADFTRFVAVGDSLGAGFLSGGLVRGAQEDSVPALVARQATGQTIEQPLVSEPGIPALLRLVSLAPLQIVTLPGNGEPLNLGLPRPYDNLSVPGYRVGDALRTFTGNPVIDLILRGQGTQLQQALALQPTFALVWLGNNDVLAAATSGRVIEGVTLTPVGQFRADYTTVVSALQGAGADLVLANLPDVTSIPFVTTIPPVVVNPATGEPVLGPGGQPIPLIGPNGPLGPNDKVLLPASAALAQGIGVPAAVGGTGQPLPDSLVLSAGEVNAIQDRVNVFNGIIRDLATQSGSALADVNALLRQANAGGFNLGGITFTADYLTGGSFSLDGVHPSPLGYALAANEFVRAINAAYGADIPPVDLFPFVFGDDASAIPSIPGAAATDFVFTGGAARQLEEALRVWESSDPGRREPPRRRPGRTASDHPTLRRPGN